MVLAKCFLTSCKMLYGFFQTLSCQDGRQCLRMSRGSMLQPIEGSTHWPTSWPANEGFGKEEGSEAGGDRVSPWYGCVCGGVACKAASCFSRLPTCAEVASTP